MHYAHYGLLEPPFSISTSTDYFYLSSNHNEILNNLIYGLSLGGFVVLTGEVGTGKTSMSRYLLSYLEESFNIASIINPPSSPEDLLLNICEEFSIKVDPGASRQILIKCIYNFLLNAYANSKNNLLVIDESHLLSVDTLEELRLLTNLENKTTRLLQVLLIGQTELNDLMSKRSLRQLSQRVTARCALLPLSLGETRSYIDFRLKAAGTSKKIFSNRAISCLWSYSQGIPRVINLISDRAILESYSKKKDIVEYDDVYLASSAIFGRNRNFFNYLIFFLLCLMSLFSVCFIFYDFTYYDFNFLKKDQSLTLNTETMPVKENPQATVLANKKINQEKRVYKIREFFDLFVANKFFFSLNYSLSHLSSLLDFSDDQSSFNTAISKKDIGSKQFLGDLDLILKYNCLLVVQMFYEGKYFYSTISSVDSDSVTFSFMGRNLVLSKESFNKIYTNKFYLLFKKINLKNNFITKQNASKDILWLSKNLSNVLNVDYFSSIYSQELSSLVRAFQLEYGLDVDGIAGPNTLLLLSLLSSNNHLRLNNV